MAEKQPKKSSALARLTPNAIKTNIDGQEIVVAANKDENDALNMVVAAQMRNLMQQNIKRYKEMGNALTPKELKELAEAFKNISQASSEIYSNAEPIGDTKPTEKAAEKTGSSLDDIKFDVITQPPSPKDESQGTGTDSE